MTKTDILNELIPLFEEVLDIRGLRLTETTSANDVAEWDSVNHLILLHAIEEHYNLKFELGEMIGFRHVGDICESILQKKNT